LKPTNRLFLIGVAQVNNFLAGFGDFPFDVLLKFSAGVCEQRCEGLDGKAPPVEKILGLVRVDAESQVPLAVLEADELADASYAQTKGLSRHLI